MGGRGSWPILESGLKGCGPLFFDKVVHNGIIIIDSYANSVNSAGIKYLRQVENMKKNEIE